tara:strand:- start:439 stop:609 length:171 start_codon:yes stop_codon:yes gene_type:complete
MLKAELEKFKEDTEKKAKKVVDLLDNKSYGDVSVVHLNVILNLMRDILGIEEPKEK